MNKANDSNQNIAKAILKIRQDNKLSQEQFAEIAGVTRQAVSRWEMGISVPNMNMFILLSERFHISLDEMLKAADVIETDKKETEILNNDRNYGILFFVIGILGLISTPFFAKWQQTKSMELFKTAYEHSYDYIFEYPLAIIFLLAWLFIGLGIYLAIKRRRVNGKKD